MSLDSRPAMCSRSRPREHRLKHHRRPRRSRPLPSRRRSPSNHLHAHEQNPDCRQFPPVLCERRRLAFRSTTTINLDDFSGFAPSTNLNKPLPPPPMSGLSASLNLASIPLPPTDDSGTTPYSPFAATSTPSPAPSSSSSSSQAFTDVLLRPEQLLPGARSGAALDDDDAADIEEQRLARQSLPRVTLPYERFRQACYHSHIPPPNYSSPIINTASTSSPSLATASATPSPVGSTTLAPEPEQISERERVRVQVPNELHRSRNSPDTNA